MKLVDMQPCPFCGSKYLSLFDDHCGHRMWVFCQSCETRGPLRFNPSDAIEAWNKRPEAK